MLRDNWRGWDVIERKGLCDARLEVVERRVDVGGMGYFLFVRTTAYICMSNSCFMGHFRFLDPRLHKSQWFQKDQNH